MSLKEGSSGLAASESSRNIVIVEKDSNSLTASKSSENSVRCFSTEIGNLQHTSKGPDLCAVVEYINTNGERRPNDGNVLQSVRNLAQEGPAPMQDFIEGLNETLHFCHLLDVWSIEPNFVITATN